MTTEYRLLTFRDDSGQARAGVLVDGLVYQATDLFAGRGDIDTSSILGLLRRWDAARDALGRAIADRPPKAGRPADALTIEAPILYPGAVFATGGNYTDHLDEMARVGKRKLEKYRVDEPFFTLKTTVHSVIGHMAPIHYPSFTKQLDWEAEIGVVIGRRVENIAEARAMEAVAGYVIVNDLSAREYVRREALPNQIIHDWLGQKCFRDSMPMGPWITPAEFVPDPYDMNIKLWVNGVLKQDGNSRNMVYPISEQIAYLSRHLVLQPGDVISTGCPAGVGVARGEFLRPGDEIRMELSHCGTLFNTVVA